MSELKAFETLANTALNFNNSVRFKGVISTLGVGVQKMIINNNDLELRKLLSNKEVFTDSISIVLKKDNHINL